MHRQWKRTCDWLVTRMWLGWALTLGVVACQGVVVYSEDTPSLEIATTPIPQSATPLQDDATLFAVHFVGDGFGCAVGDRGVCWTTRDGGATWKFTPTPVPCALRGVHFLTDQIGWAVGGEVAPYTQYASGVVLQTVDGGQTWQVLSRGLIPPLSQVQFVDRQEGLAVGQATSHCPTGILQTSDGGQTWTPVSGPRAMQWRTAAILPGGSGVVAGARGELGILGRGQLVRTVKTLEGLRGLNDVSLATDGTGWMVGDGGWALTTDNHGASWAPPDGALPTGLRDCMDFQCVAQQGNHVWIAGAPGSVIWHSSDKGRSWKPQRTGETTPIRSLVFTSDSHGVAVGDLGKIMVTRDGGSTWAATLGSGRRLALMMIHARPLQVSLGLTALYSGERGYRSGVLVLTRRDLGTDARQQMPVQLQLEEAFSTVGGSSTAIDWRLPLTVPGLDSNRNRLLDEWQLLTDQNLPEVVTADLVSRIRMWQPEVILVASPEEHDAAGRVVQDAVVDAVRAAETSPDPTGVESLVALAPWEVKKVFTRSATERGTENIDPQTYLPRSGMSIDQWAETAVSRLFPAGEWQIPTDGLTLVYSRLEQVDAARQTLFGGLEIPPGGPARRANSSLPLEGFETRKNAIVRRQSLENAIRTQMDSRSQGSEIIAQLLPRTEGLPADQRAKLFSDVAKEYRERMLWDSAEQAYSLLLTSFPDHPMAAESAAWLLSFWSSSEMNWHRLRPRLSRQTTEAINPAIAQAQFQSQLERNTKRPGELANPEADGTTSPFESQTSSVQIQEKSFGAMATESNAGADLLARNVEKWRTLAAKASSLLQSTAPGVFLEPQIQLTLASLLRKGARHTDADRIIDNLVRQGGDDHWAKLAQGEVWLLRPQSQSPRPVARCRKTSLPPRLDGKLTDVCWEGAMEVPLSELPPPETDSSFVGVRQLGAGKPGGAEEARAMVMLLYDDKFLYVAGTVPRAEQQRRDPPQTSGRTHDADLSQFDRLRFQFDTDRDYRVYYSFEIDQRGWTRDGLWDAQDWNPKWYVAPYGDDLAWRFEAAIPWEELTPSPPEKGTCWATGITRSIPTVGLQGWNHPLSETPAPETFGLLIFE